MLDEIGRRHGTDKWDAWHSFLGESFLDVYESYLGAFRPQPVTVLELGVKRGASLRMWKEYFPLGAIHGVDLNPRCQEESEERVTVHTLSQDDAQGLTALAEAVGGFDLVVDDASHINSLTAASFRILWPYVKPGGFYIIEDLGMSWIDYSRLGNQDTFMHGELKMNMDRGVAAEQDRATLDAVFRDVLYGLDNRLGTARFLHFWSGTAIMQRGGAVRQPTPTPHLSLADFLPTDSYRSLLDRVSELVARGDDADGVDGAGVDVADGTEAGDADLGAAWGGVEAAVRAVAGLVRKELELDHFSVDGVAAALTVHRSDGVTRIAQLGTPGPGTRRIDFVYSCSPDPGAFDGGQLRLHDTDERNGVRGAAATSASIDLADNSIVFFPSYAHREVMRIAPRQDGAVRYTLTGWLTGEPVFPTAQRQCP